MKSAKFVGNCPAVVPILPLRDMVVFPNVMVPLFLKGSRVVKLAESVAGGDNLVGLFYQKTIAPDTQMCHLPLQHPMINQYDQPMFYIWKIRE